VKITGDSPDDATEEQIPVIKFEKFESAKYQSILKSDIITITMGNSKDFSTLEDKIVICPGDMDPDGNGIIETETCNTINAVTEIFCTSFIVPCPAGGKFFFRLSIPGEVFSLPSDDGTGLMDCDTLMADWDPNDLNPVINIPIVNDHAKDNVKLSQLFRFQRMKYPYKRDRDLECLQPD